MATHAVKNFIRNRDFFKIVSSLETGADHGMWTFQRYRGWLDRRKVWSLPNQPEEPPDSDTSESDPALPAALPKPATAPRQPEGRESQLALEPPAGPGHRIDIEPGESEFGKILKRPGEQSAPP
jgi:hypothetical protein